MAVSLSLTATSNSITATITGLDATHEFKRTYKWKIQRSGETEKSIGTSESEPFASQHTHIITPVEYGSEYTVKVDICNEDGTQTFATKQAQATTLYTNLPQWSWTSANNGDATALQTIAAYNALTSQIREERDISNFSHLVWNDLAQYYVDMIEKAGLPWLDAYKESDQVFLENGSQFTAAIANAIIENARWPLWTWATRPGTTGYLGRQYFRGASYYSRYDNQSRIARADAVYGKYIEEMAKVYNTMAKVYNDSPLLRKMSGSLSNTLYTLRSVLANPLSMQMSRSNFFYLGIADTLHAVPSIRMSKSDSLILGIDDTLYADPSVRMAKTELLRLIINNATLHADREVPIDSILNEYLTTNLANLVNRIAFALSALNNILPDVSVNANLVDRIALGLTCLNCILPDLNTVKADLGTSPSNFIYSISNLGVNGDNSLLNLSNPQPFYAVTANAFSSTTNLEMSSPNALSAIVLESLLVTKAILARNNDIDLEALVNQLGIDAISDLVLMNSYHIMGSTSFTLTPSAVGGLIIAEKGKVDTNLSINTKSVGNLITIENAKAAYEYNFDTAAKSEVSIPVNNKIDIDFDLDSNVLGAAALIENTEGKYNAELFSESIANALSIENISNNELITVIANGIGTTPDICWAKANNNLVILTDGKGCSIDLIKLYDHLVINYSTSAALESGVLASCEVATQLTPSYSSKPTLNIPCMINAISNISLNDVATAAVIVLGVVGASSDMGLNNIANLEVESISTWDYPIEQEDGLLIRQVHLVWPYSDKAQIDWVIFDELEAETDLFVESDSNLFITHMNWEFPVQRKRILDFYQAYEIEEDNDALEIDCGT